MGLLPSEFPLAPVMNQGCVPSEFPLPAELIPVVCAVPRSVWLLSHPWLKPRSASSLCSSMNPKQSLTGWEAMPGVPCARVSLSPSPGAPLLPFSDFHPWDAVPSSSSLWNWKAPQPPGSGLVLTKPPFHPGSVMLYRWEVTFFF